MARRSSILAVLLAAGSLSACSAAGGENATQMNTGGGGGSNELAASDVEEVLQAQRTINVVCEGGDDDESRARVPQAVDTLDRIVREYPDRVYEVGSAERAVAMEELTEGIVGQLRECGYGPEASQLGEAVEFGKAQ
jgi:hypothetical protein